MDRRRLDHVRVLMYSHDTFGLGHLRRCRTIAHALVERFKGVTVLIVSGSTIVGAFDYRARVDFVKIPSVIKLWNGEYTSIDEHIDLSDTMEMRESVMLSIGKSFRPDIFIVDKEPLGLNGEIRKTLEALKTYGTTLVLGLRDVMDSPELLSRDWNKRGMLAEIEKYYDRIWVYGEEGFWDPLTGLDVSDKLRSRIAFTGYLDRFLPEAEVSPGQELPEDFVLVTAGGGGDGGRLFRQILAAREHDRSQCHPIVMVLGPFMKSDEREMIHTRAQQLDNVTIIDFDNRMEAILPRAKAVVCMCGYNTFCEILSYDLPALVIPRTSPREEQLVRARAAERCGIFDVVLPSEADDPELLAAGLKALTSRAAPSAAPRPLPLDGLENIGTLVEQCIAERQAPKLSVVGANRR